MGVSCPCKSKLKVLEGVYKVKETQSKKETKRLKPPSKTPEGREAQLINLAMNQAQKQLENGTASSQVLTHFLKLGASLVKYQKAKLEAEVELAKAKVSSIESQQHTEEIYQEALEAFKSYTGEEYDEYYD